MKIINEKGKLFGIINVVDLLILLIVVAIAGALVWQLAGDSVNEAISEEKELTAVCVIAGASSYLVEETERQELVGQQMVSGSSYVNAYITNVWYEDHMMEIPMEDGSMAVAAHPEKKDICIEFKVTVPANATGWKVGSQEVRVGKEFIVKTQTYEAIGKVYFVELAD